MSLLKTFHGGLHPPEKKSSSTSPIVTLAKPSKAVLPLSQHIGAPSKPMVKIGDTVEAGCKIAEPGGFVSAALHASISGKIVAIGNFMHPAGVASPAIVIEATPDSKEPVFSKENAFDHPVDTLRSAVQEAGIVGMGGATFPTHVKLSPPANKPIDTVILNGVECEPVLTADHRLMLENPTAVINGLQIIMKILGANSGMIGIESNKPDAIALLAEKVREIKNIEVVPLKVKYPQGGEKQLIYAATGREVPSGGLPMDTGIVVQNVATAAAVNDAVMYKKPLIERVVTLAGNCVNKPGNYLVRIGTTVAGFIEMSGGLKEGIALRKVIMGGPMMGMPLFDLNVPIMKGTSGILCWDDEEASIYAEKPCIRCGRCVEACPMSLLPQTLKVSIDAKAWEKVDQLGVLDCMECGCCAYTCPSNLPLIQSFKLGKKAVLAERKRKSDLQARERQ